MPWPLDRIELTYTAFTRRCSNVQSCKILEADPEFQGLDFSNLDSAPARHDGNDWTSKKGFFSPEQVGERAKWVRNWLRDRQEERIVVVRNPILVPPTLRTFGFERLTGPFFV